MGCQESDSSHSCLVELVGSLCPQLIHQHFCSRAKPLVGLEQALAPGSLFPNLLRIFPRRSQDASCGCLRDAGGGHVL